MYYISSDSVLDNGVAAQADSKEVLIVKDTVDDTFELQVAVKDYQPSLSISEQIDFLKSGIVAYGLWQELHDAGIMPQSVVGLFQFGDQVMITPVSKVELRVLELLSEPRFTMQDKLGGDSNREYKSYGLYNFKVGGSDWTGDGGHYCSIAKLLLDSCGEVVNEGTSKMRLETTRDHISVCVDDTSFQSTYLRFDISNYASLMKAYTKYQIMNRGGWGGHTYKYDLAFKKTEI